ncbi:MAG: glycosyltransferase family 4 protein [Actinomycetota bacterium]|nr:glycosyltransferase family 4 protein [Actinomycetota bacterium]
MTDSAARQARVLLVTRKFPPAVGGMETLSVDLWEGIVMRWPSARLLAMRTTSQVNLLWWLPLTMAKVGWLLMRKRVDCVIVGDAIVATVLRPVLRITARRRGVIGIAFVMGLDITWDQPGYRRVVSWGLKGWTRVAAISEATASVASELLGDPARVSVIRLGVGVPDFHRNRDAARAAVLGRWNIRQEVLLIVTVGRVVKRKGSAWFIESVLPHLGDAVYLVAGVGSHSEAVSEAAARAGVADKVVLTGPVTNDERENLMAGADLFVQPNIAVAGDMEGFGLVVAEASVRGAVVVASRLEGVRDAVVDGRTGILVEPESSAEWLKTIEDLRDPVRRRELGDAFGATARDRYGRAQMIHYLAQILDEARGAKG